MVSPYKHIFDKIQGNKEAGASDLEIKIDRDGADSLAGKFYTHNDFGCTIKLPGVDEEHAMFMFVAYKNMRGVGQENWDYDVIGH